MRTTWGRRVLAGLYVGTVAALAASAFSDPSAGFTWNREGVAMALTLPALLPALPVVYLLGAATWSVTGADHGGPMWPVTAAYAVLFAATAVANLWLLHLLARRRRPAGPSPRRRLPGVAP